MRFIRAICLFTVFTIANSAFALTAAAANGKGREDFTYLLAGYDDAAQNTDTLSVVSYNKVHNALTILQIPRDSYFNHGYGQNKINQLYSHKRAAGLDKHKAMKFLTDAISKAFCIDIDGYLGISMSTFAAAVDAVGGFSVELPQELSILDGVDNTVKKYNKGKNHLNGKSALQLARYRAGYKNGDLGRLELQKRLIDGMLSRASSGLSNGELLKLATVMREVNTNLSPLEGISLITGAPVNSEQSVRVFTLPGKAVTYRGISYYAIDVGAAEKILGEIFFKSPVKIDAFGRLIIPIN